MKNSWRSIYIGILFHIIPVAALADEQPLQKQVVYVLGSVNEVNNLNDEGATVQLLEFSDFAQTKEGIVMAGSGVSQEKLADYWFYRFSIGQEYFFCPVLKTQSITGFHQDEWFFETSLFIANIHLVNFDLKGHPSEDAQWKITLPSSEVVNFYTESFFRISQPSVAPTPVFVPAAALPKMPAARLILPETRNKSSAAPEQRKLSKKKIWHYWSCAFCGTNVTPERRAGPNNRKELCNACGIKYFNKTKREKAELNERRKRMSVDHLLNNNPPDS